MYISLRWRLFFVSSSGNGKLICFSFSSRTMTDGNISAILDSLQTGYDKRIRPKYGGRCLLCLFVSSRYFLLCLFSLSVLFLSTYGHITITYVAAADQEKDLEIIFPLKFLSFCYSCGQLGENRLVTLLSLPTYSVVSFFVSFFYGIVSFMVFTSPYSFLY